MLDESDYQSLLHINCQKATANAEFRIQRIARLDLLNAVEQVVDELVNAQRESTEMLRHFRDSLGHLPKSGGRPFDENEKQRECLRVVAECTRNLIQIFEGRLQSARDDPNLLGELEESVVTEFETYLRIERELHDTVVQLIWALDENSADFSPETGEFESVDDLVAHLKLL